MTLKIHNSLSHSKEVFTPIDPSNIEVYVCGPTVYDRIHIGNARPIVVFDILFRVLNRLYPKVTYVRNITDVDDKINNRAHELGIEIDDLTKHTIEDFHNDISHLNVLQPTIEPRATRHIHEMIDMIAELIEKGYAYEAEGHVLYNVPSLPWYGKLSRRNVEDMIAGARVEVAPYKRDPSDFILWKPSDDKTPGWDSPWGYGRPGWHIECSAMSCKYLGKSFDIHGGGQDLIFPHHENELAQSTALNGENSFAKYWMHNGMLTVNGEKMSKSLGNFITLYDALTLNHGETVRFMLLSTHYRQSLDWNDDSLSLAKNNLNKLYQSIRDYSGTSDGTIDSKMLEALQDDLNTHLAIARLYEMSADINRESEAVRKAELQANLIASGNFIGVLQSDPNTWFTWSPTDSDDSSEIDQLILDRNNARKNKDFNEADRIRKLLDNKSIVLEDKPEGTIWRRK